MELINETPNSVYKTSSSCSGRIAVFAEKTSSGPGLWLFVSHDKLDLNTSDPIDKLELNTSDPIIEKLFNDFNTVSAVGQATDSIFSSMQPINFKFEPFILHVTSPDAQRGQEFLSAAFDAGYRTSGLVNGKKRCMIQLKDTLKIDAPIGFYDAASKTVHLIVDASYLAHLVNVANEKFLENEKRMAKLYASLQHFLCN